MPKSPTLDWRRVEHALLSLLIEHGFRIQQERGDRYIHVNRRTVSVEEFARELADRIGD